MTATLENTVFYSIACYENVEEVIAPLVQTAEYFGVPIQFPILENHKSDYACNYDKIAKSLPFLEHWLSEGKEYAFFNDVRDTVYVDTAEHILQAYNESEISGVLFNTDRTGCCWPCDSQEIRDRIAKQYGNTGIVNSGLFCGKIEQILTLFRQAIDLHDAYICDNFGHPILAAFNEKTQDVLRANRKIYQRSDQFFLQLLQAAGSSIIQTDKEKKLLSLFTRFPSVCNRDASLNLANKAEIGSAKILHSPWRSRDVSAWKKWIDDEICRRETCNR